MKKIFLALLLLTVAANCGQAQQSEINLNYYDAGEQTFLPVLTAAALLLAIAAASVVFAKKLSEFHKKIAFAAIAAVTIATTLYLIWFVATSYLNSYAGGPVHWHADFEVWGCGEKLELQQAQGASTRVGPTLLHTHGDNRIHVEGPVRKREDVSLSNFFAATGGHFDQNEIQVVLRNTSKATYRNGDACNGKAGTVKLFVNGKQSNEYGNYAIAPHVDVPPGDVLKIVFE